MPTTRALSTAPRGTTVELLFTQLKKSIENGALAPGQRLIEADLIKDYGVSRGPLREAFRRLSAEGIIDFVPNKGAVVKKFSRKEITDIFAIRQAIEGLATRLATERLALAPHKEERRLLEQIHNHEFGVNASFAQENSTFHNTILTLCDNPQLQNLIKQMRLPFLRYQIRGSLDRHYIDSSRAEHTRIAAAMLSNDAKLAERLMQKHLGKAAERLMTLPDIFPD
ncbi:GntR family transcriptional regulator [Bordetella petrii]|uniref:GntR family transcriptional regulator n=1 Tax=Bordetella petrii TaxID=94624 RepID=UPI001E401A99|nr:GntR family transcriptional regulator [Bordetella petrii]MCD0502481.1 GntR family transcriptional regulator [Bordetella petrii]